MNLQPNVEMSSRIRRGIAFALSFFSLLVLLVVGAGTWFFKDGMGPDSIESSGWEALRRFSSDFWPIAAFCFILFGIAFLIAPRQARTRNASTNAAGQV